MLVADISQPFSLWYLCVILLCVHSGRREEAYADKEFQKNSLMFFFLFYFGYEVTDGYGVRIKSSGRSVRMVYAGL